MNADDSRKAVEVYKKGLEDLQAVLAYYTELDYRMHEALTTGVLDDEAQVDVGFLLREAETTATELRKLAKYRKETVGKIIALKVARAVGRDSTLAGTTQGSLAIAIPDVKMRPTIPKKGSQHYKELLAYFGVSQEAIDAGLLQLHWSHVSEWLTQLAEEGRTAPSQIATLRPDPMVSYRRKKPKKKAENDDE